MALELVLAALVCAVVGLLIGWSGIAGFLLPMFYVGYLKLPVAAALTLSFAAFAVSGAIGAFNYFKKGNLPIKPALWLSVGSLVGAVVGVALNAQIPADAVKVLLYLVVLASGVSILVRNRAPKPGTENKSAAQKDRLQNPGLCIVLGFATAVVCALSGAGGPILVMPLLVVLGMEVRSAIGVALLNSVFIALPSLVGYGLQSDMPALWLLLFVSCAAHAVGVIVGSRSAHIIKQKPLKTGVALFSIAIAGYMLATMWL